MCSTNIQVSQVLIEDVNADYGAPSDMLESGEHVLNCLELSLSLRHDERDFWSKPMMGLPLTTAPMIGRLKQRRQGEHNLGCWTLQVNSRRRNEVGKEASLERLRPGRH